MANAQLQAVHQHCETSATVLSICDIHWDTKVPKSTTSTKLEPKSTDDLWPIHYTSSTLGCCETFATVVSICDIRRDTKVPKSTTSTKLEPKSTNDLWPIHFTSSTLQYWRYCETFATVVSICDIRRDTQNTTNHQKVQQVPKGPKVPMTCGQYIVHGSARAQRNLCLCGFNL